MEIIEIVRKSERIVSAMMSLGATGNEEVAETTLKDLTNANFDQIDGVSSKSKEDYKDDYELLDQEVLDRIINEGRRAMIAIVDRAYQEAYYEPMANKENSRIII